MTEKEEKLEEMIEEMFNGYMSDGFDFDSNMSFTEVFKQIFSDAVAMTIDILENVEDDDTTSNDKAED